MKPPKNDTIRDIPVGGRCAGVVRGDVVGGGVVSGRNSDIVLSLPKDRQKRIRKLVAKIQRSQTEDALFDLFTKAVMECPVIDWGQYVQPRLITLLK